VVLCFEHLASGVSFHIVIVPLCFVSFAKNEGGGGL